MIAKEKQNKRLSLYNQGLSDSEIARRLGLTQNAIGYWRREQDLSPNSLRGGRVLGDKEKKRLELYNQGLNDVEIATQLGLTHEAIFAWRKSRDLLPNGRTDSRRLVLVNEDKIRLLYNQGLNDSEIGREIGCERYTITYWRRAHGLSPNFRVKKNMPLILQQKICPVCKNEFTKRAPNQIYCCPECREVAEQASSRQNGFEYTIKHNAIASLRRSYYKLLSSNPAKALEMKKIMEEEEGPEFTALALDGIVEQEFSKPEVQRKYKLVKKYKFDK